MKIIELKAMTALASFVETIGKQDETTWGIAAIKRTYLRPITNEAFLLAIRHVLIGAEDTHIFFERDEMIYVVWNGRQKYTFKQLRGLIGSALIQQGLIVDPAAIVRYIDPTVQGTALKEIMTPKKELARGSFMDFSESGDDDDEEGVLSEDSREGLSLLALAASQKDHFLEICRQRPHRKQLSILVVEDQLFSQKLLCEILRGARLKASGESPQIDVAQSIDEAWKLYLKKVPDIAFVDLGLADGSGHTLARAIKRLDPRSCVIIVTAHNYEEEQSVARQNNVDEFITKPYNKKQIMDSVDRYVGHGKQQGKGAWYGTVH